jgi:hypothetical protein
MAINGRVSTFNRSEEKAGLPGHGPVLIGMRFAADNGIYPVGLLLTLGLDDVAVPAQEVLAEVQGAGTGATTDFNGALDLALPVEPGSLVMTDGVEAFRDDGCGRLVGDAGGAGTIDYQTGNYSVSFNANVGDGVDVTADYITALDAVLDQQVDTAAEGSGMAVVHGTVARNVLKVGAVGQAAPTAKLLRALRGNGIWSL